ncbi:MAG: L-threonylcarbamoyladenylate synthase [Myxococcota bacterium]|nr:L-threonylcarbamoyladenylate synthase [Myxococcota bacterium]
MTSILTPTPANLAAAAEALLRSRVVAIPTETVYGLAGVAFDEVALATIFTVKERPTFDPLIVHVPTPPGDADIHLAELGLLDPRLLTPKARERLNTLAKAYWPGPLTLVVPRGPRVPDLVTSGLDTVAIRCPGHPVAQDLLATVKRPLAAPSANRFGRISPTTAAHVLEELGGRIELILDGGPAHVGIESVVVAVNDPPQILRPGSITKEHLETTLSESLTVAMPNASLKPQPSPGMLERHYAPGKRFVRLPTPVSSLADAAAAKLKKLVEGVEGPIALICVLGDARAAATRLRELTGRDVLAHSLSPGGDPNEAARNLFRTLRLLDSTGAALLVAEPLPTASGVLLAIVDRLSRATTPLL